MSINYFRNIGRLALSNITKSYFYRPAIIQIGAFCLIALPIKNYNFPVAHCYSSKSVKPEKMSTSTNDANSIYDFTVQDTYGNDVALSKYKGQVLLVVNIASQCGLTKNNYKELSELKQKYHEKGLRILNFPCNQFNSQMPEEDGEAMVCHLKDKNADIGDLFKKVDVNGSTAHPLFQYLKHKQRGTFGDSIKWNFTKFLIDKNGQPINRYAPTTAPMAIEKDIEELL